MRKPPPLLRDSHVLHPVAPPAEATHFQLRKGGKKAAECLFVDGNGITVAWHPIAEFDKDTITSRWGHSPSGVRDFWVMFRKETAPGQGQTLGTFKNFGIEGENVVVDDTGTEIVPGYPERSPTSGMSDVLGMLGAMKSMVDAEANSRVAEARISSEATLAATRESHANVLNIMGMFMSKTAEMARPPTPAADPMLLALLTKIDARITKIEAEFEDDEPDDPDPEEVDYKKYARLVKDVRRDGMGALLAFAKDEGAMALVDALPTLRQRLPEIMMMLKPMVEQAFASMTGKAPAAPAPQPWVPPAMSRNGASPPFAPSPEMAPNSAGDEAVDIS